MTNRFRVFPATVLTAAFLCVAVDAAGPVFWTVATQSDFLKGTPAGVSIDAAGRLLLAPPTTVVRDLSAPQAWSLLRADDGTWYAGTGGDGRVVRGRGQQVDTVLDTEPSGIHALAIAGNRVFAASSPDGRVHVIEPDGSTRVFFDPAEAYIWALAFDRQGRLWVGAGNPAVVYRVNVDGSSQVVYRPSARHVVSLAVDSTGRVFAGTDTPARLYRFGDADRPFVVLEPGFTELRSIRPGPDGSLFVAALTAGTEASSDASVTGSVTITVGGTTTGTSSTPAPSTPPSRRSVIYRVLADGTWDALWETTDAVYDLALRGDGNLLVATGQEGRLYQVSTSAATWGAVSLINTADAKQITRLAMDGSRTLALTANPGRLVAIGATATTAPTYTSPVRDAKTQAQWGSIRWEGTGAVTLHTRSGNTETPDDSWSPWSAPSPQANGQAITSPAARYLQWRATLTPGTVAPLVTSVTVAYLSRNLRPNVTEITVHPPGVVFQRPFSSEEGAIAGLDDAVADARRPPGGDPAASGAATLGRRMFSRGLQTLAWKADDPDGDRLQFSVHYRREGEDTWRLLRDQLTDMLFVWDTTSVPDGRYVTRITATDALSNTPDRVMTGDRESGVVDVDNTPPVITTSVAGLRVAIRVTDGQTGVHRVDYSIGGQSWQALRPLDGLADSREEQFELTLPSAADVARLVIRATDVMQNVTSAAAGGR
jgi:hypothetical protein